MDKDKVEKPTLESDRHNEDYFTNYYKENKDKYYLSRYRNLAIKGGLNKDLAVKLGTSVNTCSNLAKYYKKLKAEDPESLEIMMDYLTNEYDNENDNIQHASGR
jgi:hypothetical protein